MTALVFMDTETTGLSLTDDIWEFAAIRREQDGGEIELHMFIEHDTVKCRGLPEDFHADHARRFPAPCSGRITEARNAAHTIRNFTQRVHVVGAVPNFDAERLALLLRRFGIEPEWHYHLIDVENLAVGYLAGVGKRAIDEARMRDEAPPVLNWERLVPPWDSNDLSRAVGVDPDEFERHTAMGDARWAMAIYDAVAGAVDSTVPA